MNLTEQQLIGLGAMLVMLLMAWVIGGMRGDQKELEAIQKEAESQGLKESGLSLAAFVVARLRSQNTPAQERQQPDEQ